MRIEEAAAKKQANIDSGEVAIVGVNAYRSKLEQQEFEILEIDNTSVRQKQIDRLNQIKADRDNEAVKDILTQLTKAAETGEWQLLQA